MTGILNMSMRVPEPGQIGTLFNMYVCVTVVCLRREIARRIRSWSAPGSSSGATEHEDEHATPVLRARLNGPAAILRHRAVLVYFAHSRKAVRSCILYTAARSTQHADCPATLRQRRSHKPTIQMQQAHDQPVLSARKED